MKHLLLVFITPLLILGCTSQSDKSVDQDETNEIKEDSIGLKVPVVRQLRILTTNVVFIFFITTFVVIIDY